MYEDEKYKNRCLSSTNLIKNAFPNSHTFWYAPPEAEHDFNNNKLLELGDVQLHFTYMPHNGYE
jgi:hypothetical protein